MKESSFSPPVETKRTAIPRPANTSRKIHVFHGFIGVIAFIAYALPLMLLIVARPCPVPESKSVRNERHPSTLNQSLRFTSNLFGLARGHGYRNRLLLARSDDDRISSWNDGQRDWRRVICS